MNPDSSLWRKNILTPQRDGAVSMSDARRRPAVKIAPAAPNFRSARPHYMIMHGRHENIILSRSWPRARFFGDPAPGQESKPQKLDVMALKAIPDGKYSVKLELKQLDGEAAAVELEAGVDRITSADDTGRLGKIQGEDPVHRQRRLHGAA